MSLVQRCIRHKGAAVNYITATCPICTQIADLVSDLAIVQTNRDTLDDRCRELEERCAKWEEEIMELKGVIQEMGG